MPKGEINNMKVGIILEAKYENGKLFDISYLNEETETKKQEMKGRLNSLFNRRK